MEKIETADGSFNYHNKILYIKNLMHIWIYFTKICLFPSLIYVIKFAIPQINYSDWIKILAEMIYLQHEY